MSSISVGDLKSRLEYYPDDYEVIMSWNWKEREGDKLKDKHSIAMINGIEGNDRWKEVRLFN